MRNAWVPISVLTLSLLLSSCGGSPAPNDGEKAAGTSSAPVQTEQAGTKQPAEPEQADATKQVYDDSLIEEYYTDKDSYTEQYEGHEFTTEYEFHIPRLLADTEAARAINDRIDSRFTEKAKLTRSDLEEWGMCYYLDIKWETHWLGSMVALVISGETGQTLTEYGVYCYDFETGKEVSNAELLKLAGVTEEEFLVSLRRAAAQEFDRMLIQMADEYSWGLIDMRIGTLSDENLNLDMPMYLDEDKNLNVVTEISVPAGGGWYIALLKLDTDWKKGPEKTADCDFVHAQLKDGQVTVTFTETENSGFYLPDDAEFNRPYPVEGLYGTYTDLYLGVMGQDFFPHLLLLDDQGGVTFCDIIGSLPWGGLYSPGPLTGVHDVVSFESGTVSEDGGAYQTVFALQKDGTKVDLAEPVNRFRYGTPDYMENFSWVTQDLSSCLTFLPDAELQLSEGINGDTVLSCDGSLTCLGITEDGIICTYRFWGDRELVGCAAFYVSYQNPEGELHVKVLSGDPLMGVEPGEEGIMMASFG